MTQLRVVAVVPARDEAGRVGETVRALRQLEDLHEVVVVDDGSTDGTADEASDAGAAVLRLPRRAGKGGALEAAFGRLAPAHVWMFADADLGMTAGGMAPVLEEVLGGRADLAIGMLPPQANGGLGLVKGFAGTMIRAVSGFHAQAPLSGQRVLTAAALARCRPLAPGFGVETAMTIDAVRARLRVVEVPTVLAHHATGRGPAGFAHRGRQGWDILRAVVRRVRPRERRPR